MLTACTPIDPSPILAPTPTALPDDTGWMGAGSGVETRELNIVHRGRRDRLFIARIDPASMSVRVRYDRSNPRRVGEWMDTEDARLVVNAGYFDPDHTAQGLLIMDGKAFGRSYEGFGGLFGVTSGHVQVRSLIFHPYQPGEVFDQMVQSFPMLLTGDGVINAEIDADDDIAPRTVAGIDRRGRIVFLISPRPTFSLTDLAAWLAQSDLDLDSALNLDGGTSSGLVVRTTHGRWGMDSWVPVPAVISVP